MERTSLSSNSKFNLLVWKKPDFSHIYYARSDNCKLHLAKKVLLYAFSLCRYEVSIAVGILLLFNSVLAFIEEKRCLNALLDLNTSMTYMSRVLRDGIWLKMDSKQLIVGDIIRLRPGDIIPADAMIRTGSLLVDESSISGESFPVEKILESRIFCGAHVITGEVLYAFNSLHRLNVRF
jgi:magnesium-transporting ATPase (P-type)